MSLYAIVLIGLTASAVAILTTLMARDVSRTLAESDQAQLRAILRHGVDVTTARLRTQPPTAGKQTLALPTALEGFTLTVATETPNTAETPGPNRAVFTLHASSPSGASATQTLHLTRPDGAAPWQLIETTLTP